MRVAIVHDWLVTWRGGEKVLEALASLYPEAPIYTLFYDPSKVPATIRNRKVIVHPVANRFRRCRKALLPFLPLWIESLPLEHFDLVISTSSCVAKGVVVGPHAKHISYIHSPMRYVWDQRDEYLATLRRIPIVNLGVDFLSTFLRVWDTVSSTRVDAFIANSHFIRQRIRKYYGRDSVVIHPPIDTDKFRPKRHEPKKDYFLAAGALVGYKRFDLAVQACERLGCKLIVAGDGPELKRLKSIAGKHTEFLTGVSDPEWIELLRGARGLLFPGVEDFGMIAVEAMAAGTPVVAYKAGGALDFILDGKTGVFFEESSVESLSEAIERAKSVAWNSDFLSGHADQFNKDSFLRNFRNQLGPLLATH